jgi:hypothetical protein
MQSFHLHRADLGQPGTDVANWTLGEYAQNSRFSADAIDRTPRISRNPSPRD